MEILATAMFVLIPVVGWMFVTYQTCRWAVRDEVEDLHVQMMDRLNRQYDRLTDIEDILVDNIANEEGPLKTTRSDARIIKLAVLAHTPKKESPE